jgi:pimeloyl-ACP methyl ester carboxylesterase
MLWGLFIWYNTAMETVRSNDGTKIAYTKKGSGPVLIAVGGALSSSGMGYTEFADRLAAHYTVYSFDRRGRGQSGDTLPYAVEREIEDIEALIKLAGEAVYLYGHSSGAALTFETAIKLRNKIKKMALYEPPYAVDEKALAEWKTFGNNLTPLLAEKHHAEAVVLFMKLTGKTDMQIEHMRHAPFWHVFESVAPTLAYDFAVVGEGGIPVEGAARVAIPTLILYGKNSFPFMAIVAEMLHNAIPNSHLEALEGQDHNPHTAVLAPILEKFFS